MARPANNFIAQAVYRALHGKTGAELKQASRSVVLFLKRRRLASQIPAILQNLEKVIDAKTGRVRARVWSPGELPASARRELIHFLKKRYDAHEAELSEETDKNLLAGVKVEIGDEVIDLTLRRKINNLKEFLTEKHA